MRQGRIRALLIEQDPEDALRLVDLASQSQHVEISVTWERTLGEAWHELACGCDVIVICAHGAQRAALAALEEVQASVSPSAVVVIADTASRADAVRTLRHGAEDHLIRDEITASVLERSLQFAAERHRSKIALKAAEAEYRELFENALEGVYRSSADGELLTANPALVEMLGYESVEELLEIDLRDLYVNPEDRDKWLRRLETRDEIRNSEAVLRRKDGEQVIVLETTRAIRQNGNTLYFEGSLLDITERKQYESHLEHLVNHDSLTGLLSRRRFLQDLEREVERARRYGTYGSLLLIDLDDFKAINDTYGHNVGDDVLTVVGRLLKKRLRQTDLVARLGGDEFAVLTPQTGVVEAQTVAAALLDTLWNGTVRADGQRHRVGASIGIAVINYDCPSAEKVLARADQAMYSAKSAGGRDCRVFRSRKDRSMLDLKAG